MAGDSDKARDSVTGLPSVVGINFRVRMFMLLYPTWWRNSRLVGLRSDYEGHQSKEAAKEFKILFIGTIIYKAIWKAMNLAWKRKPSSHFSVSQHFFTWGSSSFLICNNVHFEEELDFLQAVATQAGPGQKFQSNLRRKQIFVLFNDCQDMLQNVDEIISQPFPVNWVFNGRLMNIEVGLICIVHTTT